MVDNRIKLKVIIAENDYSIGDIAAKTNRSTNTVRKWTSKNDDLQIPGKILDRLIGGAKVSNKKTEISFTILQSACKYTGADWQDQKNCNHSDFSFNGDLDGYGEDAGYIVRSNQLCQNDICPMLKLG